MLDSKVGTDRQTNRQTDRQTDRKTDRQTDRQTDAAQQGDGRRAMNCNKSRTQKRGNASHQEKKKKKHQAGKPFQYLRQLKMSLEEGNHFGIVVLNDSLIAQSFMRTSVFFYANSSCLYNLFFPNGCCKFDTRCPRRGQSLSDTVAFCLSISKFKNNQIRPRDSGSYEK